MADLGPASLYERLLRKFSTAVHLLSLAPFYAICLSCMGISLAPAIWLFGWIQSASADLSPVARYACLGLAAAGGYLLYGLTLIFVIPLVNFLMRAKLKPWRGPYYSLSSVRWYIHNGLGYIVRFTFLEFITPTPLNLMYFRLMGMKIGNGVQLNSSHISDPSLITMGNKVTVGGSAVIIGHYGVGGFLVLSQTIIEDGATIGLRAVIMGGVTVGQKAKVLPNSVVLPKTKIGPGETWGGVPAVRISAGKVSSEDAAPLTAMGDD